MAALALAAAGMVGAWHVAALNSRPEMARLQEQVRELRSEQQWPEHVLAQARGSICYLYIEYRDGRSHHRSIQISGTGFVVAPGWIATNRHVAEPWSDQSSHPQVRLLRRVAFFPGSAKPVILGETRVNGRSDLALLSYDPAQAPAAPPLPLAPTEDPPRLGDAILLVGYPLGVDGMIAKVSESKPADAFSADDFEAARSLARAAMLRPWATEGRIGDIQDGTLAYDADNAPGSSGAPVLNQRGEVVAVNTDYVRGFGGGIGIAARELWPLLRSANARR